MEKYDGSSDPFDHLRAFVDLMRLRATPDEIMCRAFSPTLRPMMNGTRNHPFKMSLSKNPPDTMHELQRRGDKYVDAEEAFFITKGMKDRKETESNKRKVRDEPRPREDRCKQKMIHPGPNRPSTEKEAHSTPLLTSRANILMEI
ncbi:Ribonuclease H [Abeliophyllum distichum]|uniref:Ribonuclease H n=1 Tax=Abeliophyllum distichum TaxID=126358 RepID=A0ABD1RDU5_9LAMI